MRSLDLNTLIQIVEELAKNEADGHVSMLKFTTGWKVFFGTPNLDIGEEREQVAKLQAFETLSQALEHLIINKTKI